jgi:uncharacterized protein (TIGR02466 family)
MHPNQHNLFETPIWGFMLNDQNLQTFDYTDYIIGLRENEYTQTKSNMGGWQSRDNIHEDAIFQEFNQSIISAAKGILKDYTQLEPYIQSMWANINLKGDFNAHHTHEGELSGVYYCNVPEKSGKLILVDPKVRSYVSAIKSSNFPIQPERLALIIFPSWLEHYVQPSQSDDFRISISFNIGIK